MQMDFYDTEEYQVVFAARPLIYPPFKKKLTRQVHDQHSTKVGANLRPYVHYTKVWCVFFLEYN